MSNGMNMDRFTKKQEQVASNSGQQFADVEKLVVANGLTVRLVGDFESCWEHFVDPGSGARPYYCEGPESDCPICQLATKWAYTDDPNLQKAASAIKAKEKFYFNALNRSPEGKAQHQQSKKAFLLAQGPKAMNIGIQLFSAIADVASMRQQQGQDNDPNTYDIMLTKVGSGMNTKYGAQFTGNVDPLTEEEKAYELWPLDKIAMVTPIADRKAATDALTGVKPDTSTEFNTSQMQPAAGPVASQPAPAVAPAPAQAPVAAAAAAPAAAAPAAAPAQAPVLTPAGDDYQDTNPNREYDAQTHMQVPCSNCNANMVFNQTDARKLKCHSCGTVFDNPCV